MSAVRGCAFDELKKCNRVQTVQVGRQDQMPCTFSTHLLNCTREADILVRDLALPLARVPLRALEILPHGLELGLRAVSIEAHSVRCLLLLLQLTLKLGI